MSAFLGMTIPSVGTAGPTYANNINAALNLVDAHDHSAGKGAPLKRPIAAALATSLLAASQTSYIIQNNGFGAAQTYTLPASTSSGGVYYTFVNMAGASNLIIQAANGDKIQKSDATVGSANGTATAPANGVLTLIAVPGGSPNVWYNLGALGTWAFS